ncbi:hypothetical protein U9R90_00370 [Streptomyces sp. E11-3]|uniref:hypothetical protein n=1 Tax=Streptomyces sp. E11-3 TaxID=3110112 RepID=UPI00397F7E84
MGLYLSRQGALIDWSVTDFLALLGTPLDLTALRAACQHALTDGEAGQPPPPAAPQHPLPRPGNTPGMQETLFDEMD